MNKLQKRIMRRVYFTFAHKVATNQITMKIGLFVLALYTFGKIVFVQRVFENLASNDIVHAPVFIFRALMHSEVLTLMAIGVMVYVLLSISSQLLISNTSRMRIAV